MRIIFLGPPGSGKGTQAERLTSRLAVSHLSTGEMLRSAVERRTPEGLQAAEYMNRGDLVPDEIILAMVGRRLAEADCAQGCLLDGFPRTLAQADALDALLKRANMPLDAVLDLQVDEEAVVQRLAGRGRADDRSEVIRERLAIYRQETAPLTEYYSRQGLLRPIDGQGTPDEVFQRVLAALAV
jgi:adenylate kinase